MFCPQIQAQNKHRRDQPPHLAGGLCRYNIHTSRSVYDELTAIKARSGCSYLDGKPVGIGKSKTDCSARRETSVARDLRSTTGCRGWRAEVPGGASSSNLLGICQGGVPS